MSYTVLNYHGGGANIMGIKVAQLNVLHELQLSVFS